MKQVYPDLWQSKRHSSGILNSYAYLLEHPDGNILFYNTNNEEDLQHIEDLVGVKYQLLTHRDEAAASLNRIRERFGSTLMFSEGEAEVIRNTPKPTASLTMATTNRVTSMCLKHPAIPVVASVLSTSHRTAKPICLPVIHFFNGTVDGRRSF